MTTKELIYTEINNIEEDDFDELYELLKRFAHSKQRSRKPGLLTRLQRIQIDAPEDFATNLDLYTTGEKHVESDLC